MELFLSFAPQGTVASTASCLQLHKRAERVAAALMGRLNTGDHVALVYPPGKRRGCHCATCPFSPVLHCPCLQLFWVFLLIIIAEETEALSKENIIVMMLNIYVQESTWLPPSMAACTLAVCQSLSDPRTPRTWRPLCPPSRWLLR